MDITYILVNMIFVPCLVCILFATVRMALVGLNNMPTNRFARFIGNDWWWVGAAFISLMFTGQFARGEALALPWQEFHKEAARHGNWDGVVSATIVFIVDLWLFWVPARIFVGKQPDEDRRVIYLAFALNIAVGLIFTSQDNPVYGILDNFHPSGETDGP